MLGAMSLTAISIRPLVNEDLPRLVDWFNRPHVYERWGRRAASDGLGGPGSEAATLAQVEAQYGATAEDRPAGPYVIELDGRAIGYIQWYPTADEPKYAPRSRSPTRPPSICSSARRN